MINCTDYVITFSCSRFYQNLVIYLIYVDVQEEELVRAVGTNTFDTLLAGLAAHKAKTDVQSHSPGSSQVDESASSHLEAVDCEHFQSGYSYYGFVNRFS